MVFFGGNHIGGFDHFMGYCDSHFIASCNTGNTNIPLVDPVKPM
jgi:hypothetical protein